LRVALAEGHQRVGLAAAEELKLLGREQILFERRAPSRANTQAEANPRRVALDEGRFTRMQAR
jgi:hypothetical protein